MQFLEVSPLVVSLICLKIARNQGEQIGNLPCRVGARVARLFTGSLLHMRKRITQEHALRPMRVAQVVVLK
jgi:hypothetical protein